jgi:hypothetical protein
MAEPNVSSRLSTVVGPQPGPERALGQQFSGVTGQAPEQGQPVVAGTAPQQSAQNSGQEPGTNPNPEASLR